MTTICVISCGERLRKKTIVQFWKLDRSPSLQPLTYVT